MKMFLSCPNCDTKMKMTVNSQFVCEYTRDKNGVITNCGFRAAYNKFWKVCPYCCRKIIMLSPNDDEK